MVAKDQNKQSLGQQGYQINHKYLVIRTRSRMSPFIGQNHGLGTLTTSENLLTELSARLD